MKLRYRYIRTERCCSHDNNIIFIKIYICIKQHQLCIVLNGISNKYHWKHIINLANIQCFNSNNLGLFHWYGMLSTHTITWHSYIGIINEIVQWNIEIVKSSLIIISDINHRYHFYFFSYRWVNYIIMNKWNRTCTALLRNLTKTLHVITTIMMGFSELVYHSLDIHAVSVI